MRSGFHGSEGQGEEAFQQLFKCPLFSEDSKINMFNHHLWAGLQILYFYLKVWRLSYYEYKGLQQIKKNSLGHLWLSLSFNNPKQLLNNVLEHFLTTDTWQGYICQSREWFKQKLMNFLGKSKIFTFMLFSKHLASVMLFNIKSWLHKLIKERKIHWDQWVFWIWHCDLGLRVKANPEAKNMLIAEVVLKNSLLHFIYYAFYIVKLNLFFYVQLDKNYLQKKNLLKQCNY